MVEDGRNASISRRRSLSTVYKVVIILSLVAPGIVIGVFAEWLVEQSLLFIIPIVAWIVVIVLTARRWSRTKDHDEE